MLGELNHIVESCSAATHPKMFVREPRARMELGITGWPAV